MIAEGVDGWIADLRSCAGHRSAVTSDRIELGTQLRGETRITTARGGYRRVTLGVLHHVSPAERYGVEYDADGGGSLNVGLTFDPRRFAPAEPERELRIADPLLQRDAESLALLADIAERTSRGLTLDAAAILRTLGAFVVRRCELGERDPVSHARHQIEAYFDRDLYLRHLAEEVGLRETTLLRRFARRHGITPIQYRLHVRLTRAGRMAWSEPDVPLAEIAARAGFQELPYFHRAYRRFFGATPGVHRRARSETATRPPTHAQR